MSKIEKIYYDAAMKLIDIEEERSETVANRVSQYVYDRYGYNAVSDNTAHEALVHAMDLFFI